MAAQRKRQSAGATIGGMVAGFEQAILRSTPPAEEMVEHARPDAPVPAGDGTLVSIAMPLPASPGVPDGNRGTADGADS